MFKLPSGMASNSDGLSLPSDLWLRIFDLLTDAQRVREFDRMLCPLVTSIVTRLDCEDKSRPTQSALAAWALSYPNLSHLSIPSDEHVIWSRLCFPRLLSLKLKQGDAEELYLGEESLPQLTQLEIMDLDSCIYLFDLQLPELTFLRLENLVVSSVFCRTLWASGPHQ